MSANFEIALILKRKVLYSEVIEMIKEYFSEIVFEKVYVIDNWEDEKYNNLTNISDVKITNLLDMGKIVITYARVYEDDKAGFYLINQNGKFIVELWIDTDICDELDSSHVDIHNEKIYNQMVSCILDINLKYPIEICAMGSEIDFNYDKNIQECVVNSQNIVCWILFEENNIVIPGYRRKMISQISIYWR